MSRQFYTEPQDHRHLTTVSLIICIYLKFSLLIPPPPPEQHQQPLSRTTLLAGKFLKNITKFSLRLWRGKMLKIQLLSRAIIPSSATGNKTIIVMRRGHTVHICFVFLYKVVEIIPPLVKDIGNISEMVPHQVNTFVNEICTS